METTIISVGGSVLVPDKINTGYLKEFCKLIRELAVNQQLILITGGGKTCRRYIKAAIELGDKKAEELDWIGVEVTRLNALLLHTALNDITNPEINKNPTDNVRFEKPVIIAGGWKPGFSTDMCAVKFAKSLGADRIINLTDTDYVYDKDPHEYNDAEPFKKLSWDEMKDILGDDWEPGLHEPFDPIASSEAKKDGITVAIVGMDIDNLRNCIERKEFKGTVISD